MRSRTVLLCLLIVTLLGSAYGATRKKQRSQKPRSDEAKSSRIYRDPETGQLGAPPPDVTLPGAAPGRAARTPPTPMVTLPNGGVGRMLSRSEMKMLTVTRDANGHLVFAEKEYEEVQSPAPERK